VHWSSLIDKN